MEIVHQKDKDGCVFACFAMLTGKTYDEVKKLADVFYTDGGVHMVSIPSVARKLGYKTKGVFPGKKKDLKTSCMVLHRVADDRYHALVWDHKNKRFLDPHPATTLERVRVKVILVPDD